MKIWDHVRTKIHEELVFVEKQDGSYDTTIDQQGNKIPKTYNDVMDPGVMKLSYCKDCGMLATDACKKDKRGSRTATGYYTVKNMPTSYCTCHVTVRYCSGGGIATAYCPSSSVSNVTFVAVDSAKDRYKDGVYAYRSDERYVFYAKSDGTYGGLIKTYASFCKKHMASNDQPLAVAGQELLSQKRAAVASSVLLPEDPIKKYLS